MNMASQDASDFGALDTLPVEERMFIWPHVELCPGNATCIHSTMTYESEGFTYYNLTITFEEDKDSVSLITASTNHGQTVPPIGPKDADVPHLMQHIPFSRVQCIKFVLRVPSQDNPGALIGS